MPATIPISCCSLSEKGVLIRQFRQLVALDDFEARITAKDLIERVRDTLLV